MKSKHKYFKNNYEKNDEIEKRLNRREIRDFSAE